jgi:hypothetical protein
MEAALVAPQAPPAVSNGQAGGAAVCAGSGGNVRNAPSRSALIVGNVIARTRGRHGTAGGD